MINIDNQFLFVALIGLGVLTAVLFCLDIYHLTRKTREEKIVFPLKFSEKFMLSLEKTVDREIKKAISQISQKVVYEIMEFYEKEMALFSQETKKRITDLDEKTKNEISKLSESYSQAKTSMLEEIKEKTNQSHEDLNEKIERIYQIATKSVSQKIIQTEKDIEEYKKERIKEIDEKIYLILGKIAKETLGKTINLFDHEELVSQALEKAKKEIF